jgi:hypothetical protein
VVPMSAPLPHSAADLALAPVLIAIERNLSQLRDSSDPEYDLALQLNDDSGWYHTPRERARRIQEAATRGVAAHGWQITPSADLQGLIVAHGSYRVSLMLGRRLARYVEEGVFGKTGEKVSP